MTAARGGVGAAREGLGAALAVLRAGPLRRQGFVISLIFAQFSLIFAQFSLIFAQNCRKIGSAGGQYQEIAAASQRRRGDLSIDLPPAHFGEANAPRNEVKNDVHFFLTQNKQKSC